MESWASKFKRTLSFAEVVIHVSSFNGYRWKHAPGTILESLHISRVPTIGSISATRRIVDRLITLFDQIVSGMLFAKLGCSIVSL